MRTITRRDLVKGTLLSSLGTFQIGCSAIRPKKSSVSSLKIAYITDFHYSGGEYQEKIWRQLITSLSNEPVDVVIGGGDWITEGPKLSINDAQARFEKFASMWRELKQPKELIPGNHDLVKEEGSGMLTFELFRKVFPEWSTNKRIDFPNCTLLSFQSVQNRGEHYRGYISSEQIDWLKDQLTHIPNERALILLTHIPLLTNLYQRTKGPTYIPPEDQFVSNSVEFLNLFNKHALKLVLQGHLHVHESMTWGDTTFLTGGALCGKWWNGAYHGTPPGFRLIEICQGQVLGRYVPLSHL